MHLLALDLSKSSTGWALWDGQSEKPIYGHWVLGSAYTSDGGVFAKLHQNMADLYRLSRFEFLYLEEPIHPAQLSGATNISTIRLLSGLAAHAHSFAHAMSIRRVGEVNVESWRPDFIGRINSKEAKRAAREARDAGNPKASARDSLKRLTMERCRQLGMEPRKNDEGDAIGILTYALLQNGQAPPWLAAETLRPILEGARQ